MDMKLGVVVVVPVSDVDRAKRFYETLGWRLDIDYVAGEDFRVVQLTPPGSECSIIIGPGSPRPRRARLRACSSSLSTSRRPGPSSSAAVSTWGRCSIMWAGRSTTPGPRDGHLARIRNVAAMARLPRSVIRTATAGSSKRSGRAFLDASGRDRPRRASKGDRIDGVNQV